jgi:hypothetical protein
MCTFAFFFVVTQVRFEKPIVKDLSFIMLHLINPTLLICDAVSQVTGSLLDPENEDTTTPKNVTNCLPSNTVSHPRRLVSSAVLL